MGENPSPLGEGFSLTIFEVCKSIENHHRLFIISSVILFVKSLASL